MIFRDHFSAILQAFLSSFSEASLVGTLREIPKAQASVLHFTEEETEAQRQSLA